MVDEYICLTCNKTVSFVIAEGAAIVFACATTSSTKGNKTQSKIRKRKICCLHKDVSKYRHVAVIFCGIIMLPYGPRRIS